MTESNDADAQAAGPANRAGDEARGYGSVEQSPALQHVRRNQSRWLKAASAVLSICGATFALSTLWTPSKGSTHGQGVRFIRTPVVLAEVVSGAPYGIVTFHY